MICKECKKDFVKIKSNQVYCSEVCRNKFWGRKQYEKNREKILKKISSEEHKKKMREYNKLSYVREKRNEKIKKKRRTDPLWKLKHAISDRIRSDNREFGYKIKDLEKHLGYEIKDLLSYLTDDEKTISYFLSGKYELDHIIPYHYFIVINAGDEEFRKCWSMKNLRLISKAENRGRKRKYIDWNELKEDMVDIFPKGASEIYS